MVTLSSVAARTPDGHTLFDNLDLTLGRERTGVVGRNGSGKTTLLRLIVGETAAAEGSVTRVGTVGLLDQRREPEPGERVAESLGVAAARRLLLRILAGEGAPADFDLADWGLEDRIEAALAEVGLPGLPLDRLSGSLSGGEWTRLRLAALLLTPPDLLLLDEPTNHLDAGARALLARLVGRWPGGLVVVSHDRDLLRRMDRIVELTSLGAAVFGGGYDLYAARKAVEREAAERDLADAEREAGRVARDVQQARERKARRDKAGRAVAARGSEPKILLGAMAERAENSGARENHLAARLKAEADAALIDARDKVERMRVLSIPMPQTGLAAGRTVLSMKGAAWDAPDGGFSFGPINLLLVGPERLAVMGPNGAGKSTLLRLAAGLVEPTRGVVERPAHVALLDQDASILRADETLVESYRRLNPGATLNMAQAALARFLFRNAAAQRTVGSLSGGERLRAALACVMAGARPPQLLVLDEPTNHLDLESVAAMEAALRSYDGALVMVCHDRDFLEAIGLDRTLAL